MSGVPRRAGKGATAALPRLLAISDRRALPGGLTVSAWLRTLAATVPPGLVAVQIREKDLDDHDLLALARSARAVWEPPRLLLINGRIDVALAAGADGVHLPAAGLPLAPLRRLAARHDRPLLLGRSDAYAGRGRRRRGATAPTT